MLSSPKPLKIPISVLVLVHTQALDVLLIERTGVDGFWQSVTGSCERDEPPVAAARRELLEETGIDANAHSDVVDWKLQHTFAIYPQFLHRYPPGTTHNVEHLFSICVPRDTLVTLSPREHKAHVWLPWQEATAKCRSWSNQAAIDTLPLRFHRQNSV